MMIRKIGSTPPPIEVEDVRHGRSLICAAEDRFHDEAVAGDADDTRSRPDRYVRSPPWR